MSLRARLLAPSAPRTPGGDGDDAWLRLHGVFRALTGDARRRLSDLPDRATMTDAQLRSSTEAAVERALGDVAPDVTAGDADFLRRAAIDDILGFGPIQDLIDDPTVTEIMVNGAAGVWVERDGRLVRTERAFESDEQLLRVVDRMLRASGRRVDQASPMVDARLTDGSRLNVVLPPLSVDGPAVTIRKFATAELDMAGLVAQGALSREAADFLAEAVARRLNVLVSGGTGTGKTTLLNVLSACIGRDERVVTIEDAVELAPQMPNLVRLETRPPNAEGAGEVIVRDLVRNALRMRPNRIIVGEVRGSETVDMLQAMNTGHEGSLSTVHANSPRDALRRVETMVILGGSDLPLRAIREQVASSIDLVVHLVRDAVGRRFVQRITEVTGMEGELISTADLYERATASAPLAPTGLSSARLGTRSAR